MQTHTTFSSRIVAPSCAVALVVASAGFGACYAWKVGSTHGVFLGVLSVVMALALEGIKPLAISQAIAAFSRTAIVRGCLLLTLGLFAVAYSLTSELALMAGSRGDMTAHRAQSLGQASIAKERYDRAKQELATLKPTRAIAELQALVVSCKASCPQLSAELGRAKRKSELEDTMLVSSSLMTSGSAIASADPGSTALQVYLSALGVRVSVEALSNWLTLVPVLALEVGSALAGLLMAQRVPQQVAQRPFGADHLDGPEFFPPTRAPVPHGPKSPRDKVSEAIVSRLMSQGEVLGSHRLLAKELGADRNSIARAIEDLRQSGNVLVSSNRQGTRLALAASA